MGLKRWFSRRFRRKRRNIKTDGNGITVNIVADKVTIGTEGIQYEKQVGNSEDGNCSEDVSGDSNGLPVDEGIKTIIFSPCDEDTVTSQLVTSTSKNYSDSGKCAPDENLPTAFKIGPPSLKPNKLVESGYKSPKEEKGIHDDLKLSSVGQDSLSGLVEQDGSSADTKKSIQTSRQVEPTNNVEELQFYSLVSNRFQSETQPSYHSSSSGETDVKEGISESNQANLPSTISSGVLTVKNVTREAIGATCGLNVEEKCVSCTPAGINVNSASESLHIATDENPPVPAKEPPKEMHDFTVDESSISITQPFSFESLSVNSLLSCFKNEEITNEEDDVTGTYEEDDVTGTNEEDDEIDDGDHNISGGDEENAEDHDIAEGDNEIDAVMTNVDVVIQGQDETEETQKRKEKVAKATPMHAINVIAHDLGQESMEKNFILGMRGGDECKIANGKEIGFTARDLSLMIRDIAVQCFQ